MNNSKTPKIVVGVGLAAVYASVAFYFLRDAPVSNVAQNAATVAPVPMVGESVPPPAIVPSSTDMSTSVAGQPAVVADALSPVARTTANAVETPAPQAKPVEAKPAGEAPSSGQAEVASSGDDSQITADVRTQIAAVAPASAIDVTTTDGVVELSGSVPSHEEIDKVLLAARNVAHVRSVDASALMVSN